MTWARGRDDIHAARIAAVEAQKADLLERQASLEDQVEWHGRRSGCTSPGSATGSEGGTIASTNGPDREPYAACSRFVSQRPGTLER
jgi:hypothetical protein